ncbi:MAG TPA: hypothetical protein DIT01_01495 [Lentisphaeria bacterium]|nr:hypothetical protein [Lentisphaeria bacterium]
MRIPPKFADFSLDVIQFSDGKEAAAVALAGTLATILKSIRPNTVSTMFGRKSFSYFSPSTYCSHL